MAKRTIFLSLACGLLLASAGCCCLGGRGCWPPCDTCGGPGDDCGRWWGGGGGSDCGPGCAPNCDPGCGPVGKHCGARPWMDTSCGVGCETACDDWQACGPAGPCGGCGNCGRCGPLWWFRPLHWIGGLFTCPTWVGPSCGECYKGEWCSDPPDCWDPCDRCGHYTGRGCSSCGHGGAHPGGGYPPAGLPHAGPPPVPTGEAEIIEEGAPQPTPAVKPPPPAQSQRPHKAARRIPPRTPDREEYRE